MVCKDLRSPKHIAMIKALRSHYSPPVFTVRLGAVWGQDLCLEGS